MNKKLAAILVLLVVLIGAIAALAGIGGGADQDTGQGRHCRAGQPAARRGAVAHDDVNRDNDSEGTEAGLQRPVGQRVSDECAEQSAGHQSRHEASKSAPHDRAADVMGSA